MTNTPTRLSHPENDGESLQCPKCGSQRLRILDTRHHKRNIRRRRECIACRGRFHTMEVICTFQCVPVDKHESALRPHIKASASRIAEIAAQLREMIK